MPLASLLPGKRRFYGSDKTFGSFLERDLLFDEIHGLPSEALTL